MIRTSLYLSIICFTSLSAADVEQRPIAKSKSEEERGRQAFIRLRQDSNEGTYSTDHEIIVVYNNLWKKMTPQQRVDAINRDKNKLNLR